MAEHKFFVCFFLVRQGLIIDRHLIMSSADNISKQFGRRSGLTKCQAWSVSNLFDTKVIFLKVVFGKVNFGKKNQQTTNNF